MSRHADPDVLPWPVGLGIFLTMWSVVGLIIGAAVQHPLAGWLVAMGTVGLIGVAGLTYDRCRYGRWFAK